MLKRKPQPRSPLPLPLRLGFWHRRRWMPTRFPARCPRCRRRARHVAMVCDATSRNRVHMETTWPWRTTSCGGSHPVDRRLHRAHGRRLLGPAGLLRVVPEPRRGGGPGGQHLRQRPGACRRLVRAGVAADGELRAFGRELGHQGAAAGKGRSHPLAAVANPKTPPGTCNSAPASGYLSKSVRKGRSYTNLDNTWALGYTAFPNCGII